jgi:prepilin-type N-terminal cleavage/methylation domain-containing protein
VTSPQEQGLRQARQRIWTGGRQARDQVVAEPQVHGARSREQSPTAGVHNPVSRRPSSAGEGGFTLVELLAVIVIMGIISAIAVFAIGNLSGYSSQSSCQATFRSVQLAVEAYRSQMGGYPNATVGGNPSLPATDNDLSTQNTAAAMTGPGSELFVNGDTSPNTVASAATGGPWLEALPIDLGHYSLSVSNDGTGTISVYNKTNVLLGNSSPNCPTT